MNKQFKLSVMALAVAGATNVAHAEGVELYGLIDVAVANVAHQYGADGYAQGNVSDVRDATTAPNTWSGLSSAGISPSRWGIKGDEKIDSGLNAVFQAEQRFNATSGDIVDQSKALADNVGKTTNNAANSSLNGQFFNGEAWAGLKSAELGTLTFGRQYVATAEVANLSDPTPAYLISPLQYSGTLGGGMGVSELLREDSSVKYVKDLGNGIKVTGMYKFGNVAGSQSANSAYSANLIYTGEKVTFGVAYLGAEDALKAAASGTLGVINLTQENVNGYYAAVSYKVTPELTVKAGYERFTESAPSNPGIVPTSAYNGGANVTIAASITNASGQSSTTLSTIGGIYQINPNLKLHVGYYAQNTATTDINWVNVLLDYNLSKRTDVYAGAVNESYGGGSYAAIPANSLVMIGMRHKF